MSGCGFFSRRAPQGHALPRHSAAAPRTAASASLRKGAVCATRADTCARSAGAAPSQPNASAVIAARRCCGCGLAMPAAARAMMAGAVCFAASEFARASTEHAASWRTACASASSSSAPESLEDSPARGKSDRRSGSTRRALRSALGLEHARVRTRDSAAHRAWPSMFSSAKQATHSSTIGVMEGASDEPRDSATSSSSWNSATSGVASRTASAARPPASSRGRRCAAAARSAGVSAHDDRAVAAPSADDRTAADSSPSAAPTRSGEGRRGVPWVRCWGKRGGENHKWMAEQKHAPHSGDTCGASSGHTDSHSDTNRSRDSWRWAASGLCLRGKRKVVAGKGNAR